MEVEAEASKEVENSGSRMGEEDFEWTYLGDAIGSLEGRRQLWPKRVEDDKVDDEEESSAPGCHFS